MTSISLKETIDRLSCKTYIANTLEGHNWSKNIHNSPLSTPMNHDKYYMPQLEQYKGPDNPNDEATLQKEMELSYR